MFYEQSKCFLFAFKLLPAFLLFMVGYIQETGCKWKLVSEVIGFYFVADNLSSSGKQYMTIDVFAVLHAGAHTVE